MSEETILNNDTQKLNSELQQNEQPNIEKMQIDIDLQTAFTLKLQEYDKLIAEAEANIAKIKLDKASFIYDNSVQQIVALHKERLIRSQIEEETKKQINSKKS